MKGWPLPLLSLFRIIQGTPTEDGASAILNTAQPGDAASQAEAQLKEVKAVLVQLQDIFGQDADGGGTA